MRTAVSEQHDIKNAIIETQFVYSSLMLSYLIVINNRFQFVNVWGNEQQKLYQLQ